LNIKEAIFVQIKKSPRKNSGNNYETKNKFQN